MKHTFIEILLIPLCLLIVGIVFAEEIVRIAPLTYSVKSSNVTVNGSATLLPGTALAGRESVAITNINTSSATLYIGDVNVTTSNGFPLDSTTPSISLDIDDSVSVYGITNGTNISVRILEAK